MSDCKCHRKFDCVELCRKVTSRNDFIVTYQLCDDDVEVRVPLDADKFFVLGDGVSLFLDENGALGQSVRIFALGGDVKVHTDDDEDTEPVTVAAGSSTLFEFGPDGWFAG